jgi:hypothetical protein
MTKRYRLLARAEMHGEIRDPGYEFSLEEGLRGPHRTIVADNRGAMIADHDHPDRPQRLVDEPLYVEIVEQAITE